MKYALLALLLVAFNASATSPPNPCGNHGNNCQPGDNGGNTSSSSSSNAGAVGVGVGVGLGGDGGNSTSTATGGAGGGGGNGYGGNAVGLGGSGGDSSSAVKDSGNSHNLNENNAQGGDAKAYGGNQGQHQSSTSVSGSKSIAQMASENTAVLNNHNANNSQASGNTTVTNVGGDSTLVERNAPPVFLGNLSATMSCSGGFNAGASDRNGSGAFGFTWISGDCRSVVIGREFVGIGMPDVACRVWKTTKGYKRAVKADPSLADVDCTIKPAPAAVVVPALVAPELAPRLPRG